MRLFARKSAENLCLFGLVGALFSVVLLTGCSRNDEMLLGRAIPVKPSQVLSGRPLNGRVFTIGVVVSLPAAPDWYPAAQAGMEAAAADNEVLLERPPAPTGESVNRQVQRLLVPRVNALLVWTADPNVASDAVQLAETAHIPVFTLGTVSDRGRATAHFVTTAPVADLAPEQIGRTAVDRIAAYLRGEKLKPWIVIRPESDTQKTR